MNIFVTHPSPIRSAMYLDRKRMIKMILESTQMLCTTARIMGNESEILYRETHINHPCTKWVRESEGNFKWLIKYAFALSNLYTTTYRKRHKCTDILDYLNTLNLNFPKKRRTRFVMAMPSEFKSDNIFESYKRYLKWKWKNDKSRRKIIHSHS